jgi:hypothetical protein
LKTVSYRSTDFKDFKGSDITRSKFPFYAEPLNTPGRRYSKVYKVSDLKTVMVFFVYQRSFSVEIGLPLD